jgi:ubiquinone/menaquinone biosynthesis C-methylase UbiE
MNEERASKELVQRQFGAHAEAYATSIVHAKGASLKRLVELVKPQSEWQVLDVATGAGHTAAAFAPHVAHVIASDLTQAMLAQAQALARRKGLANMETARADAEALPFPAQRFDLVTTRIAPHHFFNIDAFLAETWRVLKPGGRFALVDNIAPDVALIADTPGPELAAAASAYNALEKLRDPSHARCLGLGEWTQRITQQGFEILHREQLAKDIEFAPWAERQVAEAATLAQLRAMLLTSPPALAAFLKPRLEGDALWFTLAEAIIIAAKPG